jgi:hypothetical protein
VTTPNLSLPELAASQSQPHVTVNSAIRRLDSVLNASCIAQQDAPPGSPADGDRYLVGDSPSGEWVGHEQQLAAYIGAGWQFFEPQAGWLAYLRSVAALYIYGVGSPATWELLETGVGGSPGGGGDAIDVAYDNSTSGLAATDVQSALDELETMIGLGGGSPGADLDVVEFQAADLVKTDNTLTDTDLSFALVAGSYVIEGMILVSAHATPDAEAVLSYSGTATYYEALIQSGVVGAGSSILRHTSLPATFTYAATNTYVAMFSGLVEVSDGGTLKYRFGQITTNANECTFRKGSWMRVRPVA